MNPFKLTASLAWSSVSWVVRSALVRGWIKSEKLDARVVSIGNIQAGGAGKTPLVALVAKEAIGRNLRTCILTRGYRSKAERSGGTIVPGKLEYDAETYGDEPVLLHDLVPEAYIGIGANRIKQYRKLKSLSDSKFDLVILDDGFQHWKIKKDLEIVAVTSFNYLNAFFRDFYSALNYADLVVWTKGEREPKNYGKLRNSKVKLRYKLQPNEDKAGRYWLIAGVADPHSVFDSAKKAGYTIEKTLFLPDHFNYDGSFLNKVIEDTTAAGSKILVTSKDWVKIRDINKENLKVTVLEPELIFEEGRETWLQKLWG